MPRLILKCPYLKGGKKTAGSRKKYVRYIAGRDGAECIDPGRSQWPATKKQREMVEQLLRDFPEGREMFEHQDYLASPTRANASEFISRCMEEHIDQLTGREKYVGYIAQRPRAERMGAHALFTGGEGPLVLEQVAQEVSNHPSNVWLPIISLNREDAVRLGYDSAQRWRDLLSARAPEIAKAMKIPWEHFRWYAAFHNEGHHPHVHMICYSADGKSGFLNKDGIAAIKSGLVKEIFAGELTALYQEQTVRRDELTAQARSSMEQVIQEMQTGTLDNPRIEQLTADLARQLQTFTGKRQYGYLKPQLKAIVDEIVDELAKDHRIASAYDSWYLLREEVLRSYRDDLPERLPLSRQKEFKQVRNMVVQEALRLGQMEMPEEEAEEPLEEKADTTDIERLTARAAAGDAHAQYALGKLYRDGGAVEKDILQAVIWFSTAAEKGSSYAAYALGKLYLAGEDVPKDMEKALRWLQRSAELGNGYAQYQLGKLFLTGEDVPKDIGKAVEYLTASAQQGSQYAQYRLGRLYLLGDEVERDEEAAVHWFTESAEQGNEYAQWFLDHLHEFRGSSPFRCATRLLHHMSRIFQEQTPRPPMQVTVVDSKLRQRIREKKIAMGHKPDDHEQKM